jgi:3-deoxy-D-manno-octulosonic-acid transferase
VPFKSQAQRRKFAQLLVNGKISNETFEEWNRETGSKRLPERAAKKAAARKKTAKATRRSRVSGGRKQKSRRK